MIKVTDGMRELLQKYSAGFLSEDAVVMQIIELHEQSKPNSEPARENLLSEQHSLYLKQAIAVAICGLYESYPEDVLQTFNISELQNVVDVSEPLRNQDETIEYIYKRAWDFLLKIIPTREPLSDDSLWQIWVDSPSDMDFARAIEQAHGIGV